MKGDNLVHKDLQAQVERPVLRVQLVKMVVMEDAGLLGHLVKGVQLVFQVLRYVLRNSIISEKKTD